MSAFNKITDAIVEDFAAKHEGQAFDSAWISVIMDIVNQILEAFANCKKTPPEALAMANRPTLLQKFVLRRTVIKSVGRRDFREHGEDLIQSILDVGKRVELSDAEELLG